MSASYGNPRPNSGKFPTHPRRKARQIAAMERASARALRTPAEQMAIILGRSDGQFGKEYLRLAREDAR